MCLPPGYEKIGQCCKLKKALDWLKQSLKKTHDCDEKDGLQAR